jgi:hypothetical protein
LPVCNTVGVVTPPDALKSLVSSCAHSTEGVVFARSDLLPRSLACAIPCCGGGWSSEGPGWSRRRRRGARPTTQATLPSADHAAEIARLLVVTPPSALSARSRWS